MKRIIFSLLFSLEFAVYAQQPRAFVDMPYAPGQVVPIAYLQQSGTQGLEGIYPINDQLLAFIKGKSYRNDCTIPVSQLRYITLLHKNSQGETIVGEMIVNKAIAHEVLAIMQEMYRADYPIEKVRLVDYFNADDEKSMRANNSSSFNFRFISHTKTVSKHGKGMAVDINPLYNPYHKFLNNGKEIIEPSNAKPYLDRNAQFPYKIVKEDTCYRSFTSRGFKWGGSWNNSKDYQHFEK